VSAAPAEDNVIVMPDSTYSLSIIREGFPNLVLVLDNCHSDIGHICTPKCNPKPPPEPLRKFVGCQTLDSRVPFFKRRKRGDPVTSASRVASMIAALNWPATAGLAEDG
jgi:hypothetical protein